jgi:chaperone modulatory protein CbpM
VIDNIPMQQNAPPEHWRFTGLHLHRAKVAMRLHRDLGVNFAGAALALDLMDELDMLRTKIRVSAI